MSCLDFNALSSHARPVLPLMPWIAVTLCCMQDGTALDSRTVYSIQVCDR